MNIKYHNGYPAIEQPIAFLRLFVPPMITNCLHSRPDLNFSDH